VQGFLNYNPNLNQVYTPEEDEMSCPED